MEDSTRTITIPICAELSPADRALVDQSFAAFPTADIRWQWQPGQGILSLTRLDYDHFCQRIAATRLQAANEQTNQLLSTILAEVSAVKSYGIRTGKRLYAGYNLERKVINRQDKTLNRGIHYYTRDHGFSTQNTLLPPAFTDTILCADSEELLRQLPDNCIDLIFTSPPYNFGLDYAAGEDDHKWEKYFARLFAIFDQCIRVLAWGGRIIVNIQPLYSDYIPSHHLISRYFVDKKLIWKGEILWEKNNYNCKYTAWGSWKSPSSPYLKYTWEFLEIFCKGSLKKEGTREEIDIEGDEFKKWVYAKWSIAPERKMKKYGHPAMFPCELVSRALKLFSYQGDVVLDPFNGAGTTTLVARDTGRRYLGVDISEEYCAIARRRLNGEDFSHPEADDQPSNTN